MYSMCEDKAPFQRGEIVVTGDVVWKVVYCWRCVKGVWHAELVPPGRSYDGMANLYPCSMLKTFKDYIKFKTRRIYAG